MTSCLRQPENPGFEGLPETEGSGNGTVGPRTECGIRHFLLDVENGVGMVTVADMGLPCGPLLTTLVVETALYRSQGLLAVKESEVFRAAWDARA